MLWTGWKKIKSIQIEMLSRARFETGWSWKVWGCELHLCLSLSVSCTVYTVYLALRTLWQSTACGKDCGFFPGIDQSWQPSVSFWRGEWWWYSSCAGDSWPWVHGVSSRAKDGHEVPHSAPVPCIANHAAYHSRSCQASRSVLVFPPGLLLSFSLK